MELYPLSKLTLKSTIYFFLNPWEDESQTFVEVPNELVPAVRELLAKKVESSLISVNQS